MSRWTELRMVVAFTRLAAFTLVVSSAMKDKIKTIAVLKGRQIAFGGTPGDLLYLIAKAGLKLADVQLVEGSDVSEIASGLGTSDWAAALETEPNNDKALFAQALEHSLPTFSKDDLVTASDVKNAMDVNQALGVIKPNQPIDITRLYTTEFVNQVK